MARKYDDMTNEDFDFYLKEEIEKITPSELLAIPGIYEVLAEELNNQVLDAWAADQKNQEG